MSYPLAQMLRFPGVIQKLIFLVFISLVSFVSTAEALEYYNLESGWLVNNRNYQFLGNTSVSGALAVGTGGLTVGTGTNFSVSPSGYLSYKPAGTACAAAQVLSWSGTLNAWACSNDSVGISGSGLTTNYVTKWNGSAIANSQIFDTGTGVGIGTASPAASLDVNGTSIFRNTLLITANKSINFTSPGIGSTSPGGFQWLLATDNAAMYAVENASDNTDYVFKLDDNATDGGDRYVFWNTSWQGIANDRWPLMMNGTWAAFDPRFSGNVSTGSMTSATMYMDYVNRRVGVKTLTPLADFHVSGSVRLDVGSDATGDIHYRDSTGNLVRLGIGSSSQILSVAGGLPSWQSAAASLSGSVWSLSGNTIGSNDFLGSTNAQALVMKTNNTERIRVLSAVSSTGALLFVNGGDAVINGVTVGLGNSQRSGNTVVGNGALIANTTGNNNTANGVNALQINTTGTVNTAIGSYTLFNNTTGTYNVAIGSNALLVNATGNNNVANGFQALYSNTSGSNNVANGGFSLGANSTGSGNVAMGYEALLTATGVDFQTAVGYQTLRSNTTGTSNAALGYRALYSNTIGSGNTAIGNEALYTATGVNFQTAVGYLALRNSTSGYENTALGYKSLFTNTTGAANTAVGTYALGENITGTDNTVIGDYVANRTQSSYNTFIGSSAGGGQVLGGSNTAVGYAAYNSFTAFGNGNFNTAFGPFSLAFNGGGNYNAAYGYQSLYSNNTGSGNTVFGSLAFMSNTTGNFNTALGYNTIVTSSGLTNATAIGANAVVSASNSLILGSGANVGIGTSTPGAKLDIAGTVKIADGSQGAGKILTSDSAGLASWQSAATSLSGSVWSLSGNVVSTNDFLGSTNTQDLVFKTNGVERMRIFSGATAQGAIASFTGNVLINGITLGGSPGGDTTSIALGGQALYSATGTGLGSKENTAIGDNALGSLVPTAGSFGRRNTAIGASSQFVSISGFNNTTVGWRSFFNGSGSNNDAFGQSSLYMVAGDYNTALGSFTLGNLTSGSNNTAVGNSAFNSITSGSNNVGLGYRAGYTQTSGSNNVVIGYNVSLPSTMGSNQLNLADIIYGTGLVGAGAGNIGIGTSSPGAKLEVAGQVKITGGTPGLNKILTSDATGLASWQSATASLSGSVWSLSGNTVGVNDFLGSTNAQDLVFKTNGSEVLRIFSGATSGKQVLSITDDILIGTGGGYIIAGFGPGSPTWRYTNTTFGMDALKLNTSARKSVAIGNSALGNNIFGDSNTAVGYSALLNNTGTSYNTAIGTNSLRQSWGSSNTALGESSLNNILNGDQNVSVGRTANQYLGTGSSNVGIGYNAGLNFTSGNNNIAIGASSSLPSNTGDNQLSIGNWIYGTSGNIGIGTASPGAKLEVAGTVKINTAGAYLDYRPNATACTAAQVLAWSGSVNGWVCSNDSVGISGSGLTTNYLTKWNGAAVANSQVFDNGTNVGIGTSTGTSKLTVAGSALVTGDITVQGKVITDTIVNRTVANVTISGSLLPDTAAPLAYRDIGNDTTQSWNNLYLSGQIKIKGGSPGLNKVLTSDSTGLASWQSATTSLSGSVWTLSGNTVGSSDFIGSTNNQDFVIRTFNTEKVRILSLFSTTGALLFVNGGDAVINGVTVGRGVTGMLTNTVLGNGSLGTTAQSGLGNNTAIGSSTLIGNTSGASNTAIGVSSLGANTTGSFNTAIGQGSLGTSNASLNTAIGYMAGSNLSGGGNNIAIGSNTSLPLSNGTNQINIGNLIYGSGASGSGAGNIGIGTSTPGQKLEVAGNVLATSYMTASDRTLKKDITPIVGGLAKILSLHGYDFSWKADGRKDMGIIAQEVEQVFPNIVHTNAQGIKSVEYSNLVAPMIEAMREQQATIDHQQQEINLLKTSLEKIEVSLKK